MARLLARVFLLAAILAAARNPSRAAEHPARPETLDQKSIHRLYNEGDFESVIAALGGFMGRNPAFSREDSVFIAKHLAVVYCANPGTREKGRYYMYRLLELVPSAKLVDMYVSEEIDRIFEKVKDEYQTRRASESGEAPEASAAAAHAGSAAGSARPLAASPPPSAPSQGRVQKDGKGRQGHKGLWIAGGAAVLAAGAAGAYFLYREDGPRQAHYRVPSTVAGP